MQEDRLKRSLSVVSKVRAVIGKKVVSLCCKEREIKGSSEVGSVVGQACIVSILLICYSVYKAYSAPPSSRNIIRVHSELFHSSSMKH